MSKNKNKKKPADSSFPVSDKPSNIYFQPSRISAEEFEQAFEAAIEAGDDEGAMEIMNKAPHWMQREPEFMLMRASVLLSLGDHLE